MHLVGFIIRIEQSKGFSVSSTLTNFQISVWLSDIFTAVGYLWTKFSSRQSRWLDCFLLYLITPFNAISDEMEDARVNLLMIN